VILEGVVTTVNSLGVLNVAPMGPRVDDGFDRFVLRPFRTSTTYRNLIEMREGVLHVTDDVLLIAQASIGKAPNAPTIPASLVRGHILRDACRYYEFRVVAVDDHHERAEFTVETVAEGRIRDFFGFNRAKHAVIEAAILATRVTLLPPEDILRDLEKLETIVNKTAGPQEAEAFEILRSYMRDQLQPPSSQAEPHP
jgi:uncharacterized protein